MKRSVFKPLLIGLTVLMASSCAKNSKLNPVTVPPVNNDLNPVQNPKIAHVICDYDFNDTTLTNHGWTKSFDDEFDGDLSQWNVWHGGGFQKELQCYEPANATISNGVLKLTSTAETVTGPKTIGNDTAATFNFTSGGVQSKTPISASPATPKVLTVARIKIPRAYGLASAFWSYGNSWPQQGEVDYLEARCDDPTTYFTDFFYGTDLNKNIVPVPQSFVQNRTDGDLSQCYHVYEMLWEQNQLTVYLDGQVVETKASSYVSDLFGKTEYVTLNLAVGGLLYNDITKANIQNATMYVDYVKVFTSK
ncbi:MAG TPA: glycoside hydrolase family 16 protein [Mucilaginibacter sp.]|nr:glycoside hydrolase family 16 protein [Mucilaginibacter sp.]